MNMKVLHGLADLRAATVAWIRAGERIGVVPTMGALHDGHLSLVAAAKARCDHVIVTIFVNPRQFNNLEDLTDYPRTEQEDARKLERLDIDILYVPDIEQVYPQGFSTTVTVGDLTDVMEGAHRPGHFDGVATVVAKLFLQTSATDAFFGEKDFQQLQVVRRMANDLDIPVSIHACPTVRENDGLAMSSRNLLLPDHARSKAPLLHHEIGRIATGLAKGLSFATLRMAALERLQDAGYTCVDYLELRASDDLALLEEPTRPARIFVAAWLAGVRLIDNIAVSS